MNLLSLALTLTLCATPAAEGDLASEEAAWHADRIKRLLSEDGWLSLVGLHWLEEGSHAAGSARTNELVFPPGAPAQLGVFLREGKTVRFTPASGARVLVNGQPFTGGALKSDATGKPDLAQVGNVRFLVIERGEKIGVRVKDADAPARAAFTDIALYPVEARWRVEARLVPANPPRSIRVPTVLGTVESMPSPGQLVFQLEGKPFELTAVSEGDDTLFIIFGDQTNRDETYGAGRFLYAAAPKDGKVVLDFNRAFNPPCAFSKFATCPLPPPGNRLPLRVLAGEKRYSH